jgi:RNA 3'-terminal phosphate cyclase (ATP)
MTSSTARSGAVIEIDGSTGEGGGQILRTSLAMSMATGVPFRMVNIRSKRPKPGLMRQHLTCVQAAQAVCCAEVDGAAVKSQTLTFWPGPIVNRTFDFQIGSAGGTTLVLQAILPALLRAPGPSTVSVEGGTHNPAAPPFEFFALTLAPLLNKCGAQVTARLERHGFYPAGGGRIVVEVHPPPAGAALPLELLARGERRATCARALVSRLSLSIAHREINVMRTKLDLLPEALHAVDVENPRGTGNIAMAELHYEHVTEVVSTVGQVETSAERVGQLVVDQVRDYLAHDKPTGSYLADQLMAPLAVLAGGRYATGTLTPHSRTNMETLRKFGVRVAATQDGVVSVDGIGAR